MALELAPISRSIVLHLALPMRPEGAEKASSSPTSPAAAALGVGCLPWAPGSCPAAISRACGLAKLVAEFAAGSTLPGGVSVRCRVNRALGVPVLLKLLCCAAAAGAGAAVPACAGAGDGGGAGGGRGCLADAVGKGAMTRPAVLLADSMMLLPVAGWLSSPTGSPSSCRALAGCSATPM